MTVSPFDHYEQAKSRQQELLRQAAAERWPAEARRGWKQERAARRKARRDQKRGGTAAARTVRPAA